MYHGERPDATDPKCPELWPGLAPSFAIAVIRDVARDAVHAGERTLGGEHRHVAVQCAPDEARVRVEI
jgi:hypothetical protein